MNRLVQWIILTCSSNNDNNNKNNVIIIMCENEWLCLFVSKPYISGSSSNQAEKRLGIIFMNWASWWLDYFSYYEISGATEIVPPLQSCRCFYSRCTSSLRLTNADSVPLKGQAYSMLQKILSLQKNYIYIYRNRA